jgi:hypothetical protein
VKPDAPPDSQLHADVVSSQDYLREIGRETIGGLMQLAGRDRDRMAGMLSAMIQDELAKPAPAAAGGRMKQLDPKLVVNLPHVVARWYSDTRYLENGRPRALPFRARGPCVAEINVAVFPNEDPRVVLKALVKTGALIRRGRLYHPASRGVVFSADSDSRRAYTLVPWYGFVRAVRANLGKSGSNVVRASINTRYPMSEIQTFKKRSSERTDEFLHPFDDWLINRETQDEATALVVQCAFSFVLPNRQPPQQRRKKSPPKRSSGG